MYYFSETMGNIVATKREIILQVFESLLLFRCLDLKWTRIKSEAEIYNSLKLFTAKTYYDFEKSYKKPILSIARRF